MWLSPGAWGVFGACVLCEQLGQLAGKGRTRQQDVAPGRARRRREVGLHVGEKRDYGNAACGRVQFQGAQCVHSRAGPMVQIEDHGAGRALRNSPFEAAKVHWLDGHAHQSRGLPDL